MDPPRHAVFTERSGPNAGRLHAAYHTYDQSFEMTVFYTCEDTPGSSNFYTGLAVGLDGYLPGVTPDPDVDLFVDSNGEAHLVWVGERPVGAQRVQGVYYARVGRTGAIQPRLISPPTITKAAHPRVAAVRLPGESAARPHVAFVGNRPGGTNTAVCLLTGPQGGGTTGTFTMRTLTGAGETGHRNLAFDLVEGLRSSGGGVPPAQGAIVYQRGDGLYAIASDGTDAGGLMFRPPQTIASSLVTGDFQPALAVQTVSGQPEGYVGHVAYLPYAGGQLRYIQFSPLEGNGGLVTEQLASPLAESVPQGGWPDIIVEPAAELEDRFDKRVSVAFRDAPSRSIRVFRNSGGVSPRFGLGPVGGAQPRAITDFDNWGTVATGNEPMTRGSGPGVLGLTYRNGAHRLRVAYRTGVGAIGFGDYMLANEAGLPAPPAGDDPAPRPTPQPEPTPTPGPTLTPPPDSVSRTEIIDTLLGLRGVTSPERAHLGDRNEDGVWDAADVLLPRQ